MADLIIKPTSGNLLIKDDQDATRLTVATSTGATTLTNQVFPSGHILQCRGDRYDSKNEGGTISVTQSTTTPFAANLEVAITCASTNNFLKIDVHIPDCYTGSNGGGFHLGFVYDTSSFASSYTGLPGIAGSSASGQYIVSPYNFYHSNGTDLFPVSSMVYCPVPTVTAMKIRPFLQSQNAETYELLSNHATFSGQASITVMEIQA